MDFKIDENMPWTVVAILRKGGHDAVHVLDQEMGGAPDERLAQVCLEEKRVILTLDRRFGDIRSYPPGAHSGIIVFRLADQSTPAVERALETCQEMFSEEDPTGSIWIVEETRVRIRT